MDKKTLISVGTTLAISLATGAVSFAGSGDNIKMHAESSESTSDKMPSGHCGGGKSMDENCSDKADGNCSANKTDGSCGGKMDKTKQKDASGRCGAVGKCGTHKTDK